MNSMYEDVVAFHQQILEVLPPETPTWREPTWFEERVRFLDEEMDELRAARRLRNMVGTTDALLDIAYVALGTLYMMGVPTQECWDAVQQANMSKVKGVGKRGNKIDAIKPAGWTPPEATIRKALEQAVRRSDDAGHSQDTGTETHLPEAGSGVRTD